MKKTIILTICTVLALQVAKAQGEEETPWFKNGQVYGKVYANIHSEFIDSHAKGFDLERAYLGYKANMNDKFSGNIKMDLGSAKDVSGDLAKKRFMYVKNAYIQYKYDKFTFKLGIADCYQFKVQEKFWGYRYVFKSFQDKHKFGSSADIGFFTTYKASGNLSVDLSVTNGEGYGYIQEDEDFKYAFGTTFKPIDLLTLRVYGDINTSEDTTRQEPQYNAAAFAGIKTDIVSFGIEYNYQGNSGYVYNQSKYGTSAYTTIKATDKINVFGRYDWLYSNKLKHGDDPWNINKDGSNVIVGCQYAPYKKMKVSANYRRWITSKDDADDTNAVYINFELSF